MLNTCFVASLDSVYVCRNLAHAVGDLLASVNRRNRILQGRMLHCLRQFGFVDNITARHVVRFKAICCFCGDTGR